jgi:intein/homing endonuclease
MPLAPRRLVTWPGRYAVYFDGIDDYVVITPFTVYGWSEITIQEWIYPYHPKANTTWSKFSMIGVYIPDYTSIFYGTNNRFDYTWLSPQFVARKPDGTPYVYEYNFVAYVNNWINCVQRFTSAREWSFWLNASKKTYATVPSDYMTVLERDPNTSGSPAHYRRFVLGANSIMSEWMKLMQFQLLIYSRALSDSEIAFNYNNPFNPVRDGLRVCLIADPKYIRDIDGDGILEWIDLSGYCITEDSRGFFDQGYVEVSMVSSGEKILTINGFSPIIRQYKRYYNGDVVVIGSRGFVVGLTPEHKVLVVPRKIVKTYRRTQSMRRWLKKDTHPPSFNPLWVPASEVNVWDYLVVPKPAFPEEEVFIEPFPKMHVTKKLLIFDAYLKGLSSREVVEKYGFKANTVRTYYTRWRKGQKLPERYVSVAGKQLLDEDWATIFGWYVAEGYVNVNSGKILFTLGPDEEEDAKQLVRLLRGKGLSPYFAKRKYSVTVGVSSKPFAHFLVENFGTGALQKKIPAWMFNAKTNIIQAFLKAYGKGDGWIRRKNKGKKYYSLISFQTASPKLVEGVTLLLMKLGIFPHIAPMNGRGVCTIMGKVVKQNPAWDIRVEGYDVLKLFDDLPVASQRKARYLQDDKFFYIPVTKKEIKHYNGYVYDFETKSHTLGMPFIIHNSNHGKIYGATLVDLYKAPVRTLPAARTKLVAR